MTLDPGARTESTTSTTAAVTGTIMLVRDPQDTNIADPDHLLQEGIATEIDIDTIMKVGAIVTGPTTRTGQRDAEDLILRKKVTATIKIMKTIISMGTRTRKKPKKTEKVVLIYPKRGLKTLSREL